MNFGRFGAATVRGYWGWMVRRLVLVVAVTLLAGACGSSSSSSPAVKGLRLRGAFTLTAPDISGITGTATSCSGTGGYSDFGAGMDVTVKDGDGTIVGVGHTENLDAEDVVPYHGIPPKDATRIQLATMLSGVNEYRSCWVKFDVPIKRADFYQVQVGHRGDLSYSYDDLVRDGFFVQLTLGGDT